MKRVFVLAFLPIVLFGLETVNLIKDAGFEKDSEVWLMRSEADGEYDSTEINRHDPDSAYKGDYCGSIDTRKQPAEALPDMYYLTGTLFQIFMYPKKLKDLDSLIFSHAAIFRHEGVKTSTSSYGLRLEFSNGDVIEAWYFWGAPDLTPADDTPTEKLFPDTISNEGEWQNVKRNLNTDLVDIKGLSLEIELDSIMFWGEGINFNTWRGQKAFFDGIRLMGYADYDVGVKEILSGDSLEVGTPYAPVVRIKNFGRENADSFLVMTEIWDGSSLIYVDTLPWTLESDTEDTVTFADFDPPTTGPYTLTVRTHMTPDECDEDDEVSKEIGHTAITETTLPDGLSLEVRSIASPLQVSYSLPYGEQGTLTLFDATGRRIERMAVTRSGSVEFNSTLASGVYVVKLECGSAKITSKVIVLR